MRAQEGDRPVSPAVSHLRRSAAAPQSRPPPPWPSCPARTLRPQPRYSPARGRGIAPRDPRDSTGWAPATVPPGRRALAPRSPGPSSAPSAPRPPLLRSALCRESGAVGFTVACRWRSSPGVLPGSKTSGCLSLQQEEGCRELTGGSTASRSFLRQIKVPDYESEIFRSTSQRQSPFFLLPTPSQPQQPVGTKETLVKC